MIRVRAVAIAVATSALAACGSGSTELIGDDALPGLQSLAVSPGSSRVDLDDLAVTHTLDLVATGTFDDGSERDVSASVTWSTDRADAGTFPSPAHWLGTNRAGGVSTITARSGSITGSAQIEIYVDLTLTDPAAPPPAGSTTAFDPPTPVIVGDPQRSPSIIYPATETMVPLGLAPILVQYGLGTVADVIRLELVGPYLDVTVFTTADRWLPDATAWDLVTRTIAGSAATLTAAGVDLADPTAVWESTPIELDVARDEIPGSIYYWSSSGAGVMKAALAHPTAAQFYPEPPDATCVGCHTLSRDGRRLAAGYGAEKLQEITVPDRQVTIPVGRDAGWSTFSPDGHRLVIGNKGVLTLLDADTGMPVGAGMGRLPVDHATHPDWSPLGDHVVVAQCMRADDNRTVEGCSIVRIPYSDDAWGTPETLVGAAGGMDNNYFPRYSPDGAWIAYVHATGMSRDQASAELRLIPAGGGAPIMLVRANHRVGPDGDVAAIANTMPAWAPATHRGVQWLAFASARPYGSIAIGPAQLWVAAIDLSRGVDPSLAAFWLPVQDPGERNHRPYWSFDPDEPCPGGPEVCDGFDNDCDGVVDDDCIQCDDGTDGGCVE